MAGLREQKKAQTRKAIIESAVQLFSDKGFADTSIGDIAKRAGIGKATVYTYFATKDEIFLNFCDESLDAAFATLQTPRNNDVKILDQLVEFFMLKFRFVTKNQEFGRHLLREMLFPKEVNKNAKEHDQRYFDILKDLLLGAQKRGELSGNQDPFLLSAHFFSLYLGILTGWYGGYFDNEVAVEEGMRQLFGHVFVGISL